MKRILVVYYSQTGQLTQILKNLVAPLVASGETELVWEALQPRPAYPFPWKALAFTDVFPESVLQQPCGLAPMAFDPDGGYDLVILAYTVWYLAPSPPVTAFLHSPEAARVLGGRPVVTLIGCRNMWLMAHEKVKNHIVRNNGIPVGNIVLTDRAPNLVGVITIAYWMLTGRKERLWGLLPRPGISDADIAAAGRFAPPLQTALSDNDWAGLQARLNCLGAVTVVPAYILFEQRIGKIFQVWARFIRRKGGPGDPARNGRLLLFRCYLLTAIFLLAPAATLATAVLKRLKRNRLKELVTHFAENRIGPIKH